MESAKCHTHCFLPPEQVSWPVWPEAGSLWESSGSSAAEPQGRPLQCSAWGLHAQILASWEQGRKGSGGCGHSSPSFSPTFVPPLGPARCVCLLQGWAGQTFSAESCRELWECFSCPCSVAESNTHLLFQSPGLGVWLSGPSAPGLKQQPPRCHPLCPRAS